MGKLSLSEMACSVWPPLKYMPKMKGPYWPKNGFTHSLGSYRRFVASFLHLIVFVLQMHGNHTMSTSFSIRISGMCFISAFAMTSVFGLPSLTQLQRLILPFGNMICGERLSMLTAPEHNIYSLGWVASPLQQLVPNHPRLPFPR